MTVASLFALYLLIAQSAPPAPAAAPAAVAPVTSVAEAPAPPVASWDRPFADGLMEVRRLAESGSIDEAVAIAERLVAPNSLARKVEELVRAGGWKARAGRALESVGDTLDLLGPPPAVRAEAQHARAVALRLGADRAEAEDERAVRREQAGLAFESARLLAGPGALRLDATYDLGSLFLAAGEEQRAKLPEISGQPAQPPPPPPVAAPGGAAPQAPPDPLQLARAAYLAARERLVERLRMDWRDPDTQANVELVQRRLRELDEIERQREQEKKEQEQQQKDEQKDQQKQDQKDPSKEEKPDESKDQQKPDQPEEQDPGQDQEPKPDPMEEPPPEDGQDKKQEQAPEPKPADPKDAPKMSKEEMLQLLERLEKIEEVQKDLQEKLKRMRRVSVEKDW